MSPVGAAMPGMAGRPASLATLGALATLGVLLAGCARSNFGRQADVTDVESALAGGGLRVCAEQPLEWSATPGFVGGVYLEVDTECATGGAGSTATPGARIWVARFATPDARDLALANAEFVYRRHVGAAVVWSDGPLVVVLDGDQRPAVAGAVRTALAAQGAQ